MKDILIAVPIHIKGNPGHLDLFFNTYNGVSTELQNEMNYRAASCAVSNN